MIWIFQDDLSCNGLLFVFRHPLMIGTAQYRIILVKFRNSIYIEFHPGNHKYYDKVRRNPKMTG